MANPTTYFGWVMPNSADLVTDLPADFNVFGQGVDTSMQYLLGGTTGQILSKTSGTNMAFTWINNDQGDITGVTAGTGISGGGTSGTVTVTNSMATEITAKGDLIAGTGNATFDNLPVGANNTKLVAASGETTGLKYVGFQGASVSNSVPQTIPNNTYTTLTFDSEAIDTDAFHSTSVNTGRITIPAGMAGKYLITCSFLIAPNATGLRQFRVRNNAVQVFQVGEIAGNASLYLSQSASFIINLAVADFLDLQVNQTSGGNLDYYGRSGEIPFTATYLGA